MQPLLLAGVLLLLPLLERIQVHGVGGGHGVRVVVVLLGVHVVVQVLHAVLQGGPLKRLHICCCCGCAVGWPLG